MEGEVTEAQVNAMREQVWNEIEARWQREVEAHPKLKENDPQVVYEGVEGVDLKLRAEYEADWTAGKINKYLYNFEVFFREQHREQSLGLMSWYRPSEPENTSLRKSKSMEEFHADLDKAMEQVGISKEEYKKIEEVKDKASKYGSAELKFQQTLLKIFIRLRLMGYSNHDLLASTPR